MQGYSGDVAQVAVLGTDQEPPEPFVAEEPNAQSEVEEPSDDDPAVPTEANTVDEIKAYLDSQGISYSSSLNKADLLALIP